MDLDAVCLCCGWAGDFMLNYMHFAQLSLSADTKTWFLQGSLTQLVKYPSGSNHWLLFASGTEIKILDYMVPPSLRVKYCVLQFTYPRQEKCYVV